MCMWIFFKVEPSGRTRLPITVLLYINHKQPEDLM